MAKRRKLLEIERGLVRRKLLPYACSGSSWKKIGHEILGHHRWQDAQKMKSHPRCWLGTMKVAWSNFTPYDLTKVVSTLFRFQVTSQLLVIPGLDSGSGLS